jgi:hypothetical protein
MDAPLKIEQKAKEQEGLFRNSTDSQQHAFGTISGKIKKKIVNAKYLLIKKETTQNFPLFQFISYLACTT